MKIFHSSRELSQDYKNAAVAIGNFDGVHLGHQEILRRLRASSAAPLLVYTFWPHPAKTLVPKAAPKMIQTQAQKAAVLESLGVSAGVFEPFDNAFSQFSARAFFEEILVKRLAPSHIAVGYDFTFGHRREGTAKQLELWGQEAGIAVSVVEPFFYRETLVSSSAIRHLLADGEVEEAAILLGRPYEYLGKVVPGDARGKRMGFPTANLAGESEMLLKEGVYATWATCGGRRYRSVSNIGTNPTFVGERPVHVEVHILEFSADFYGQELAVSFAKRLRGEQHFKDVEALREQIAADIAEAKNVLR